MASINILPGLVEGTENNEAIVLIPAVTDQDRRLLLGWAGAWQAKVGGGTAGVDAVLRGQRG